jgi:hypothetical protein
MSSPEPPPPPRSHAAAWWGIAAAAVVLAGVYPILLDRTPAVTGRGVADPSWSVHCTFSDADTRPHEWAFALPADPGGDKIPPHSARIVGTRMLVRFRVESARNFGRVGPGDEVAVTGTARSEDSRGAGAGRRPAHRRHPQGRGDSAVNPSPLLLACVLALVYPDPGRMLPPPIDLAAVTLEAAREMNGTAARFVFTVGCPPWAGDGVACIGPGDMPDGSERSAVLVGERRDINVGDWVEVVGVLRVLHRPAETINGVELPVWWQVTVTGATLLK